MTNEINGLPPAQGRRGETATARAERGEAEGKAPDRPSAGDRVSLTATASTLGEVRAQIDRASEVDGNKVAAVREALASGSYRPDAGAVADKLVALETLINVPGKAR